MAIDCRVRLWNPVTSRREYALSLSGLPEHLAVVQPAELIDQTMTPERAMLRNYGFSKAETEYFIAFTVEQYSLRELPERLQLTPHQVERLRASVNRKIRKLRVQIKPVLP